MTGGLGIALSAQGFRGLFLAKNAHTAWEFTDPIGRLDFRFSERQFDLVVRHIEQDFLLSLGSLILFLSLFLGGVVNKTTECCGTKVIYWARTLLVGIILSLVIGRIVHQAAIRYAGREVEHQARSIAEHAPEGNERIRNLIQSWFKRRVGRDPKF